MKKLVVNYIFAPSTKQVTLTDYTTVYVEGLLLITNVTSNIIIYNFANPLLGGSVAGNVITLDYDTVAMNSSDKLQIYYDDSSTSAATEESLVLLQEQNAYLRRLLKATDSLSVTDESQRQRVAIATWEISTSAYIGRFYPYEGSTSIWATNGSIFGSSSYFTIPGIWEMMDVARTNFAQGIRANLQFS